MKSTFYGLLLVSFIALHIHGGSCGNYGRIEKRGAEEEPNESMKDVFTKKDKRQTDDDECESCEEEEDTESSSVEDEARKKRDATDMFKEGMENFKEKAREGMENFKQGMDKMRTMFAPKSKREVLDNQVAREKRQAEGKNPFDKIEKDKFGRKKREALEADVNNKRLVHYDVRESYETRYTFI
jgi:hypothetical protein